MKVVRYADLRPTPWRNGGGETRELAVHPPGAALDAFDWRVSMARVASNGPFSTFPGVDRTLAVLGGAGMDLVVGAAAPVRLNAASMPFAFPADVATAASLADGPVEDLNVMTRREEFRHTVTAVGSAGALGVEARGGTLIVVCGAGQVTAGDAMLGARDAMVLEGAERLEIAARGPAARVLLVSIRAL